MWEYGWIIIILANALRNLVVLLYFKVVYWCISYFHFWPFVCHFLKCCISGGDVLLYFVLGCCWLCKAFFASVVRAFCMFVGAFCYLELLLLR